MPSTAANVLEWIGGLSSVAPVRERAERLWVGGAEDQTLLEAIHRIEPRHGEASLSQGRLAVVAPDTGRLSEAASEGAMAGVKGT